jgi:hypothetical protein
VTVESFHVEGCRTCREALLELALMAGILRGGPLDVTVSFGEPIAFDEGADRKALTRQAECCASIKTDCGRAQPECPGCEPSSTGGLLAQARRNALEQHFA